MKTYNPKEVSVIIGGLILKSWNIVTVEMDEDRALFTSGTTGEATRTINNNKLGAITIELPQSSADNLILSGLLVADAIVPCMVKDNQGNSIHIMAEGALVKFPSSEYGPEHGTREWQIKGNINDPQIVGGN